MARTAAALAVRRELGETGDQFPPSAPNGFPIQTADPRQFDVTGTIRLLRQQPNIPAALGFVEPAEKQVYALMLLDGTMIRTCLADRAFARMNTYRTRFGHTGPPVWMASVYQPGEVILL